jgi:RNA polymerase sigma-70 factor, ECF subfamily
VSSDAERDDALLDRLARTGDARAFDILYRRHTQALYATAVRITRDAEAAADIVHDTWVRAVESLHRFENRSAVRTWLTGILINCQRERERERRRDRTEEDLAVDDVLDPTSASPLDAAQFDRLDLEAAIAALSPRFRQVLVLHDIEGFTHEEIASMLGLVPGTSKSQLARARRRVREMLETGIPRNAP